ncbi:hypothetical protein AR457_34435 [Streptomyces agglomeratus]|nr:hypothetical protein AR457_34435 [Streptomyces agglomeratus]
MINTPGERFSDPKETAVRDRDPRTEQEGQIVREAKSRPSPSTARKARQPAIRINELTSGGPQRAPPTSIADQVRIRRDLHPLRTGDETVTDLKILTGRRMDLVADRTRTVNRLRAQLTGIFPGLERLLDLTNKGPLTLLTGYQTPAAIRRLGAKRLETWLRNRKVGTCPEWWTPLTPAPAGAG